MCHYSLRFQLSQRCQLNLGRDHEAEAELDALVEEYASDDAKKVREESMTVDNGDEDVRKLFCLACNKSFKSQLQMKCAQHPPLPPRRSP